MAGAESSAKIFVGGATGNIGGKIVDELLAAGASVTAGVRDAAKGAKLAEKGAALGVFDTTNESTFDALKDHAAAFFVAPFAETSKAQLLASIAAAKAQGVGHVVLLSAAGVPAKEEDVKLDGHRSFFEAQKALAESGMGYTILQPQFFMENQLWYDADAIKGYGCIMSSAGEGKYGPISIDDIAAFAAKVLQSPGDFAGKTVPLNGPELASDADIAAVIAKHVGYPVVHANKTDEEMSKMFGDWGVPAYNKAMMEAFGTMKRAGYAAVTDEMCDNVVKTTIGRELVTLDQFWSRDSSKAALAKGTEAKAE